MDSARKRDPLLPWLIASAFNIFEFLHESDGGVTRFREGKLFYPRIISLQIFFSTDRFRRGWAYVLGIFLDLR